MTTRANGLPALGWYTPGSDKHWQLHSIHVMRFEAAKLAEATNFIGAYYLHGFDLPERLANSHRSEERKISEGTAQFHLPSGS